MVSSELRTELRSSSEATFSGTTTGGTLTVTDGTHTAKISRVGPRRMPLRGCRGHDRFDINRKFAGCPTARKVLEDGVRNADQLTGWPAKAWALRDAFDGLMNAIAAHRGGPE